MSEDMIETNENITEPVTENAEIAAEPKEIEEKADVRVDDTSGETADTDSEGPDTETGDESAQVETPKVYTQEEVDALAAAARKKGISKGKKEMSEQLGQSLDSLHANPGQLYDPATGQLMDPSNPVYNNVTQKLQEDATLEYNKKIRLQMFEEQKAQGKQDEMLQEAKTGYLNQVSVLRDDDPNAASFVQEKITNDWATQAYDGIIYTATTTKNGVSVLAKLAKDKPAEIERLSNLPPLKQAAEMTRLIDIANKGNGAPIKKSNAPAPAASFANGGSSSAKKSPENKTIDDIEAEMRAEIFGK